MSQLVRNVGLVGYKQLGPGLWPLLLFHSPLVRRTREIAFRMWAHKSVESSLAKQRKSSPAYRGFGRTCLTVADREKGYIHHQHTAVFFTCENCLSNCYIVIYSQKWFLDLKCIKSILQVTGLCLGPQGELTALSQTPWLHFCDLFLCRVGCKTTAQSVILRSHFAAVKDWVRRAGKVQRGGEGSSPTTSSWICHCCLI